MSDINPNSANYTKEHVDFAQEMAKFLAKKKGFQMDSKMAVLPRSWMYNIPDTVEGLAQGRYQNQFMQGADTLAGRQTDPNYQSPIGNTTIGGAVSSGLGNLLKSMWGGIKNNIPGNTPAPSSDDKSITTGSLDPETPKTPSEDLGLGDQGVSPAEVGKQAQQEQPADNPWKTEVKRSENAPLLTGKKTTDKAEWDYQQHSNGFGTKAKYPGEVINAEEAHKRFDSEWAKAEASVEKFKPNLPFGVKAALTSLTFNSGEKWQKDGLGQAIQRGDMEDAKKRFLQYNRAGNKPNDGLIERRQREVKWFDNDLSPTGDQPAKAAGQPNFEGRMNAGLSSLAGDDTEKSMTPMGNEIKLAQAIPGYTATPVTTPNKGESQNVPGGYQGVVPPAGPLESKAQLDARLRAASPEQRKEIIDDYMKRAKGDSYKTQGGGNLIVTPTPGGGQPTATHIPGPDIPLSIGGMGLHLRQNPNGGFDVIMPGGGSGGHVKDMSLDELNRLGARLTADRKSVEDIGAAQTKPITEQIEQSTVAPARAQTLQTLEALVKSTPELSMGPTSKYFNEAKRLIANFFPKLDVKGIEAADSIEKLNSLLASESTKLFTNRGTNFDLQTFMNANPNLRQSRGGMLMMIDLLKQETEQSKDLGRLANSYKNKSVESWNDRKEEYYNDHPLIIKEPIGEGKFRQITTKKITSKEERDALPKDMGYIDPNGEIRYRK